MKEIKYCEDCKWHRQTSARESVCIHPEINGGEAFIVRNGYEDFCPCTIARRHDCGKKARYFEGEE